MLHSEIVSELKNIGVQVKPYNVQDGFMDIFVNGEVYDMFVKFVKENNLEVIYDNIHHWDIFTWCDATIWFYSQIEYKIWRQLLSV